MLNNNHIDIIQNKTIDTDVNNLNLFFTDFLLKKGNSVTNDTNKFEEISVVSNHDFFNKIKKTKSYYMSSINFWNSLFSCSEAILVDKYFNKYMINSLINQLKIKYLDNKNLSIKILLNNNINHLDEIIKLDKLEEVEEIVKGKKNLTIDIYRSEMTYIHDRFAFMDDKMWHFGAAIGNMNYNITAYSIHKKSDSLCNYFIQEIQNSKLLKDYLNAI